MSSIQEDMKELQRQLGKGSIQKAYGALLSYIMRLRKHFTNKYGDHLVSALYQGYMDMTYFAIFPFSFTQRDLKVAIVFNYKTFMFEGWLAARNRKVQRQYCELFKGSQWAEYRLVTPAAGIDSIIEFGLINDFDFDDMDGMTSTIENATTAFIDNIEKFLSEHQLEKKGELRGQ